MSRHEIGTSRSGSVVANGEIRVPLDQDGFRRDRNRTSIAATMGVTMTLGFCGFPALLLYMWVTDPAERNTTLAIVGAALSLVLPVVLCVVAGAADACHRWGGPLFSVTAHYQRGDMARDANCQSSDKDVEGEIAGLDCQSGRHTGLFFKLCLWLYSVEPN